MESSPFTPEDYPATSKVIIYDSNAHYQSRIRTFCRAHNLIPVKPVGPNILEVLASNVDLGGIFLSEDILNNPCLLYTSPSPRDRG